jgi:serralysin
VTVVNGTKLFGPQGGAAVNVQTGDLVGQFFAYDPRFQGGLFVAAGDFNGDGRSEIVTGPDQGGGPHIVVFTLNPANPNINTNFVQFGTLFPGVTPFAAAGFFAYDAGFSGGVRVAVGDVNGDGFMDIITGAGPGGGPHVKVFSGAPGGGVIRSFFAYDPGFRGGVYVAAGDYDLVANGVTPGKFTADIMTGAGAGGGPHVKVFSGSGSGLLTEFFAFGPDSGPSIFGVDLGVSTGVGSVAFSDVDGNSAPDIFVTTFRGPRTRLAAFKNNGATVQRVALTVPQPPFQLDPSGDLIALNPSGVPFRDGAWVGGFFGG